MGKSRTHQIKSIYRNLFRAFGPQHWWPGESPFEVAVGAILTQNTNWGNVERAIGNLKSANGLNATTLAEMSAQRLADLIRPAGYFNIKAKRLKAFLHFLVTRYGASMKRMATRNAGDLREELLSVHGIGPETADSILLYAVGRPVFVIDAYTKRVLSRHGIMDHNRSYEEFQELFHATIPRDVRLFNEYHALFVKVGKEYCKPRPRCAECPLRELLLP